MFEDLIIFAITSSPQRLVHLCLVGEYVPFLPLVGFWVFVSAGCTVLKFLFCSVFLVSCILVELSNIQYMDSIKLSRSEFELHTHSCVRVVNINRDPLF